MRQFLSTARKLMVCSLACLFFLPSCVKDDATVDVALVNKLSNEKGQISTEWMNLSLELTKETPGFTVPVAARAFAYIGLGMYEVLVPGMKDYKSMQGKLAGFTPGTMHDVNSGNLDWGLAFNESMYHLYKMIYRNSSPAGLEAIEKLYNKYQNAILPNVTKAVAESSMVLLCVWIFLPENDPTGFYFLLIALLIKSAFSGLHLWLPEAHSGPPAHGSATYSGLMINLPFILFLRYSPPSLATFGPIEFLIFFSGLGIFLGGITSFFHSDLKKTLAYSTVENSNFLWLNLLISKFWMGNENPILNQLGFAFLILFYITLTHHSISKIYQFLSFGYLAKLGGSTSTDECKGIGRISGLPFLASSMGSLSFAMIPGTVGFLSESTFLYLTTVVIDLPTTASINSPPISKHGPTHGTRIPPLSFGPKPPMRSSNA